MSPMASQITSLTIVYSPIYSGTDQRKHQTLRHWPMCGEFTEDPAQMASNAENVSIRWRHHDTESVSLSGRYHGYHYNLLIHPFLVHDTYDDVHVFVMA